MSRGGLYISKEGDSMTSLGNLFWVLSLHYSKKCFRIFRWQLLCFSLCPLHFIHYWAPLNRAPLCHLCTLTSDIYILIIFTWAFFSTDWTVTAFLTFSNNEMLQPPNHLSGFLQCVHVSLVRDSTELDPALQVWSSQCWIKGKNQQMGKAGRDHWGSSSPTSQLNQGPPEHVTQECV